MKNITYLGTFKYTKNYKHAFFSKRARIFNSGHVTLPKKSDQTSWTFFLGYYQLKIAVVDLFTYDNWTSV